MINAEYLVQTAEECFRLADLASDNADVAAGIQRIGDALMNKAVALETQCSAGRPRDNSLIRR